MIRSGVLLRWLALRHFRRHLLRTALAISSVAIGVATFLGMSALNRMTEESFENTARELAGSADWVVRAGAHGVPVDLAAELEVIDGIDAAIPLAMRLLRLVPPGPEGSLLFVGVDPGPLAERLGVLPGDLIRELASPFELLRAQRPVFVSASWAERHSVSSGDVLQVATGKGPREVYVAGLVDAGQITAAFGGAVAVSSFAVTQELAGHESTADRVLVAASASISTAELSELRVELEAVIAGRGELQDPLREARDLDAVMGSLRMVLAVLSMLSLVLAGFLVHSTLSMALIERRRELSLLRCLGLPGRSLMWMLVTEAACIGMLGALPGLLFGGLLARGLSTLFWATVGSTFDQVQPAPVSFHLGEFAIGLAAGVLAAVFAAFFPARRAAAEPPLWGLTPRTEGRRQLRGVRAWWLPALLAGISGELYRRDGLGIPHGGFVVLLFIVATLVAVAGPLLGLVTGRGRRWLLRVFGVPARLSRDALVRTPGPTALTLVAIGLSFGLVFSTDVLMRSLKGMLGEWFDQTIGEDLFIMGEGFLDSGLQGGGFDVAMAEELYDVDSVLHVHPIRLNRVYLGEDRVLLLSLDAGAPDEAGQFRYFQRSPDDRARWARGEGVYISEGLAYRQNLQTGDRLKLASPSGPLSLEVLAVVADYSWPLGVVLADDDFYRREFHDDQVHEFALTLDGSRSVEEVRREIEVSVAARYPAIVLTQSEVQSVVYSVFREYWALLFAQEGMAVLIGFLGTFHCLLIAVLLQRRDLGLLRAVGATPRVAASVVRCQGLWLGSFGGLLAIGFGLAAAQVTLGLITLHEQGYRVPLLWSWTVAVVVVAGAAATGWVAALAPSRSAARLDVLRAIEDE